jgi:hypothetical protein
VATNTRELGLDVLCTLAEGMLTGGTSFINIFSRSYHVRACIGEINRGRKWYHLIGLPLALNANIFFLILKNLLKL